MRELLDNIDALLFSFPPFVVVPYCVYKLIKAPYPGSKSFLLILSASTICCILMEFMEMVMMDLDPLITLLPLRGLQLHSITALAALPGWVFLYLLKMLHQVHCPNRVLLYCCGLVWVIAPIMCFFHISK